jgi:tetraacyldisaccharide 4'-kinase
LSALPAPPRPPRSPWQRLYGTLLARRAERLRARARRLSRPVVSIGNLHWGGSGKTPFVIALASHLRDAGQRVAVLSRGYRRTTRGALVISRGDGPLVAVDEAGDEPYQMAEELAGVAVVVAERRFDAGELALAELAGEVDTFVLDDGFSHVALARDVDCLLFPAADPWARGRLAPGGFLREPLAAAARADAAVSTGAADPADGGALAAALAPFGFRGRGFASVTEALGPYRLDGAELAAGTRVFALAAIAHPERFHAAAERAGLVLVGREGFRDHWHYSELDVRDIERAARRAGAEAVLVTAKDRAKLAGRLALPLAVLPIAARPEAAFWPWLGERLEAARR